jgi:hypothetical protein
MNNTSNPIVSTTSAPTLAMPLLLKISHLSRSGSFGSGLCNQSSFSTSSGNRSRPEPGRMLNFSETVCVFISSSLPAREGALESSKGETKGLTLESSELQLVRRDDSAEGERIGDSSR